MELMQMAFTTSRKAEILDLLANVGGVAAGIVLTHITLKILAGFRSSPPDHS